MRTVLQRNTAFTLLDLLAVLAAVIVLIGILLPALGSAKRSAEDLKSLGNLRSHGQILAAYASDWDGSFPQFADPHSDFSVVRGGGLTITFEYFVGVVWWPVALADSYYDGNIVGNEAFLHPLNEREQFNVYTLSSSLMALPGYWVRETREAGTSQWVDQVVFASAKAQLIEWHPRRPPPIATEDFVSDQAGVAFSLVDGAASRYHTNELVPPYPFGDGSGPGTYQPVGIFGMHTQRGWLGRDVR